MKKALFSILLLFVCLCTVHATVLKDDFWYMFQYRYHYVDSQGKFGDFEIIRRNSDNALAYCIEPGNGLASGSYIGYTHLPYQELSSFVNISEKQLQDISLYAYFGYEYQDHYDSSWIVSAQSKIWQTLGRKFQFTSRNSSASPYQYVIDTPLEIQEEMQELERLKNEYYEGLHFDKYTLELGQDITIQDPRLEEYYLVDNNEDVSKDGDTITIQGNHLGNYHIHLQRDFTDYPDEFIVYQNDEAQNLFLVGNIPSLQTTILYEIKGRDVTLEKVDEKTFGKAIGGDIAGGKKTWLTVRAFSKADPARKEELLRAFAMPSGSPEERAAKIDAVLSVYNALNIEEDAKYEILRLNDKAMDFASCSCSGLRLEVLRRFCEKLVGRTR